jgi:hypothetical protein
MNENRFYNPQNKSRYDLLYPKLKDEVFRLLENNVKLSAYWNAGGDETPGGIDFSPESASDEDMGEALFWAIISALNLPGAGETYDEGTGEIYRGADNSLRLKFTSRERTYGIEKERADETFVMPVGDLLPLRELQHQAGIYLAGSLNDFGTIYSWVRITDSNKKQIEISEAEEENYKEAVESVLHSYSQAIELEKAENSDYPNACVGGSVNAHFKEFTEEGAAFNISFSYELVLAHDDEDVVLIDAAGELLEWKGRLL